MLYEKYSTVFGFDPPKQNSFYLLCIVKYKSLLVLIQYLEGEIQEYVPGCKKVQGQSEARLQVTKKTKLFINIPFTEMIFNR